MTSTTSSDLSPLPGLDELRDELAFLADDRDRCDYLIDLGFELPQLPEEERVEENRIHGCQSNVWLVGAMTRKDDDAEPLLRFVANSDAMFVNGLIVVLRALFHEKSATEVASVDLQSEMKALDLDDLVTPQRKNGLMGMVQRLRQIAEAQS